MGTRKAVSRAKTRGMRVVLDTNVVVSALLFSRGRLSWLREGWQHLHFAPLVSRPTTEELLVVLSYPKFKLNQGDRDHLLADYLPWCETVAHPKAWPALPKCRDTDDQKFLDLAAVTVADYLVTGDQDLLVLDGKCKVPILTQEEFRQLWEIQPT
jgi:putative PIN family toxin of toxin-antitoxin system